jgi:hypothetical protein
MVRPILRINCDYFPKQFQPTGLCNGNASVSYEAELGFLNSRKDYCFRGLGQIRIRNLNGPDIVTAWYHGILLLTSDVTLNNFQNTPLFVSISRTVPE